MKIGAIVPVRLASERLPGKALLPLGDRSVIQQLLTRIVACKHIADPHDVVVCTTEDASDDPLVKHVEPAGFSVFRGARDDILRRFGDAIDQFGFDAVIQADGDDPFSATEYMDLTMDRLLAGSGTDIVTVEGLPLGIAVKSFTAKAMQRVLAHYATERNDTGFIYYFTKTGLCEELRLAPVGPEHIHETVRLTLDYDEDLAMMRALVGHFQNGTIPSLAALVEAVRVNPDLVDMNRHVEEEYWQRTAEKAVLFVRDDDGALLPVGD